MFDIQTKLKLNLISISYSITYDIQILFQDLKNQRLEDSSSPSDSSIVTKTI